MFFRKLYPNGKKKAFTLSYDDGVGQDIPLIEILNRYDLKGTFNLNSGLLKKGNGYTNHGVKVEKLDLSEAPSVYRGHEAAVHTVTHPHLEDLTYQEICQEVQEDIKALETTFGYQIRGMAYPCGSYNDLVLKALADCGILYSRTTSYTEGFGLPENPLTWHSTCHHKNPNLIKIADRFLNTQEQLALFYVWGHSYEFDMDDNWNVMENLAQKIAHKEDIWYATNGEIMSYLNAISKCIIYHKSVRNPSEQTVWMELDGRVYAIAPKETIELP